MIDLGSRLELFVDDYLLERLRGDIRLCLQQPVLTRRAPGRALVCYSTILHENGLYRRYQREVRKSYKGERFDGHPGEITTYLESGDGVRWQKKELNLIEIDGSRHNNVALAGDSMSSHNFTPFRDENPHAREKSKYKALGGVHAGGGLYAWVSADGLKWRKLRSKPVITSAGFAFDSQNVSFWSSIEKQYVCYFRTWETSHGWLRTISRCTSDDFIHWSEPVAMDPNLPGEHLYTSGTHPYFRAPHIYIALPTRFVPDRGESTDILFMNSRAGDVHYARTFTEAFIRPGLEESRWGNRANYAAWRVVETGAEEMSIYANDRRYVLRTDGFVALRGGAKGGELLTRPFTFSGGELCLNYSTSAAGSLRAELRDAENKPLAGFRLRDCEPLVGDHIARALQWKGGRSVGELAGRPVRLRFVVEDGDLYSLRFV
ncbi:MAG: hypothetical protein ACI906_003928 [Candidatus Latescibacterota bacterium]|jgi:hypothetical protein